MNEAHYVSVEAVDLQSKISLVGVQNRENDFTQTLNDNDNEATSKIINGSIQLTVSISMNRVDSFNSFSYFFIIIFIFARRIYAEVS